MNLTRFADVITLTSTRIPDPLAAGIERFVGLEHIEPENLHIRSWGLVADGTTFTNTFQRGQVLFGKRRAYQRKVAIAEFDGVCSSDIYVFESKAPTVLLPELVPFILQSEGFYEYAVKTSAGSLSPRTNWTHLANYEFPLLPVDEQRRIADLLWAAEDYKQQLESLYRLAEQLLYTLRLTLVKPGYAGDSQLIGDIAKLAIERVRVSPSEGYPTIGIYSFGRGILSRGVRPGFETKYNYLHRVRAEQIVLSKLKAWEGAIAVAESEHDLSFVSPEYPTFELNRKFITPDYMKLICESPWFWRNISGLSQGTAERRARINPKDFLKVPIFVPPLQEQEQIVERINLVKSTLNVCKKRLEDTSHLKRALLNHFFGK